MDGAQGRSPDYPATPTEKSPLKTQLSPGWEAKYDRKSGRNFYVHHERRLMRYGPRATPARRAARVARAPSVLRVARVASCSRICFSTLMALSLPSSACHCPAGFLLWWGITRRSERRPRPRSTSTLITARSSAAVWWKRATSHLISSLTGALRGPFRKSRRESSDAWKSGHVAVARSCSSSSQPLLKRSARWRPKT